MKFPMAMRLTGAGLCAVMCAVFAGCDKPAAPAAAAAAKVVSSVAIARTNGAAGVDSWLQWRMATTVDAYKKFGRTDPAWDEPAIRALTEFARVRSQDFQSNENPRLIVSTNCQAAMYAGCNDPLIRYLSLCLITNKPAEKRDRVDAFATMALEMEASSYPKIRKFYAWHWMGREVNSAYGYGKKIPQEWVALGPWYRAESNLVEALEDRTMPPDEAVKACAEILKVWAKDKSRYPFLYHELEGKFPSGWSEEPVILLFKGENCIDLAWLARGHGYSDEVTAQGWQLFEEYNGMAEKALTHAWELNPSEPRIALKMIDVELGQGQGRDRMEMWFERAMALNTNYYNACKSKLNYLEPKWFGSVDDMLAFARECVHSTKWGGHVPLVMLDAHNDIQRQFASESRKQDYWEEPEVWLDLKSAFDRFFELNPKEIGWYHDYAFCAYRAKRWRELEEIIPKLGPINYKFFGGREKFDAMVAEAAQHAGGVKAKD
jgi:hypothetical protein